MSHLDLRKTRYALAVLLLGQLILLSGCGNTNVKPSTPETPDTQMSLDQLREFITNAESLSEPKKTDALLLAADQLYKAGETEWARSLLNKHHLAQLNQAQQIQLLLLQGKIAIRNGDPYLAKRFLYHDIIQLPLNETKPETLSDLFDLRATLSFDLADYLTSIDERLTLSQWVENDEVLAQLNHDLLWETLAEVPISQLFDLAKIEKNANKQGWFSLAAISRSNGANFRQQITDIEKWQSIWPNHPANKLLPADLQLILQLADEQARHIAVLLPLTGKLKSAADAIKDGILAAYYDDLSAGQIAPKITFYDTYEANLEDIYAQASIEGAELVIGPLNREHVATLVSKPSLLSLPTLALNSASDTEIASSLNANIAPAVPSTDEALDTAQNASPSIRLNNTLYQFSLAIENEAKQVAQKAWRDGHRNALVIAPESTWGDRATQAFQDEWDTLGGVTVGDRRFKDQRSYSPMIEQAVGVRDSKTRHTQLRRLLGSQLEFEPRRRQDIDFIFLLAYASQGVQIKPLLSFHYAGDVPVYSTSHIYEGDTDKSWSDLNGVRFSTLPWYFDSQLAERRAIQAYGDAQASYQALYALGVDAYHLYPRLKQLKKISQARFYGATGKLSVDKNNIIQREQSWAKIVNGRAIQINNASATQTQE